MNDINKNIKNLNKIFAAVFLTLILYLAYIQFFTADRLHKLAADPRLEEDIKNRGIIYSTNLIAMAVNAQDPKDKENWIRYYPYASAAADVIGYDSLIYGKTGLEEYLNSYLLFDNKINSIFKLERFLKGENWSGFDCVITINENVQQKAYDSIKSHKGAAVVLNPRTGEIIALATSPSFDPNNLNAGWNNLVNNPDSPLINRATESLYPPGSTFKVFTLSSALDSETINESYSLNCTGSYEAGSLGAGKGKYYIQEAHGGAHGRVDYPAALIYSCNIAFADIALKMGPEIFLSYIKKFGLKDSISFELPVTRANFSRKDEFYMGVLAQSGFGQGDIAVTPLQMAMIVSAVANEGKIMRPFLLKDVKDKKGGMIFVNKPGILYNPIDKKTADKVKNIMIDAVERGTGTAAMIDKVTVAGKTGTAENPHGKDHAWFIGFAPADDPEVLVCVIIEGGGYGGTVAAPIAREIMIAALKK